MTEPNPKKFRQASIASFARRAKIKQYFLSLWGIMASWGFQSKSVKKSILTFPTSDKIIVNRNGKMNALLIWPHRQWGKINSLLLLPSLHYNVVEQTARSPTFTVNKYFPKYVFYALESGSCLEEICYLPQHTTNMMFSALPQFGSSFSSCAVCKSYVSHLYYRRHHHHNHAFDLLLLLLLYISIGWFFFFFFIK